MSYTIGIGLLIGAPFYNDIRAIELQLATETHNPAGLGQPPHVTVKAPFEVSSVQDIEQCSKIMAAIAEKTSPFTLTLDGVGNFGEDLLYLRVNADERLHRLHYDLLTELEAHFPKARGKFEAEKMTFHSTLAMDLTSEQFKTGRQILESMAPDSTKFTILAQRIGLFLGMDDNTRWIVLSETTLH